MSPWKRWARRLLFGALSLAILYLGALTAVGCVASARLEEAIARIRAAGEPVTLAEAAPPRLAPGENAATALEEACALLRAASEEEAQADPALSSWPPPTDLLEDPFGGDQGLAARARAWTSRRQAVRAPLEVALARPRCRFDNDWEAGFEATYPQIPGLLELQSWILLETALAARDGDAAAAWDGCGRALALPALVGEDGVLLSLLLRASGEESALRLLERVLGRLPLPPAVRERLLPALERAEAPLAHARALLWDRCAGSDAFQRIDDGTWDAFQAAWLVGAGAGTRLLGALLPRAVLRLDHAHYLAGMAEAIALARRPYAQAREGWEALGDAARDTPWYGVISPRILVAHQSVAWRWASRTARLRLARLALALEAARRPDGTLPDAWAPAAGADGALDPFDGRPLRARRGADGAWLLWSVGPDGDDDLGTACEDDAQQGDLVWRVAARVPPP